MSEPTRDLWVFGYGSLMWRPGFLYEEARHARLNGYRRCFCIYSVHHRGTLRRPGMVLGLDRGGTCEGIAFRIASAYVSATTRYLRAREQIYGVYRHIYASIELTEEPRRNVLALTYVAERAHPNYAQLPAAVQARLIREGKGVSGTNLDYFVNTLRHLAELGIRERELERLTVLVGPYACRRCGGEGVSPCAAALIATSRSRPMHTSRCTTRRPFVYRLHLEGST
jgi:glutathione-specific gamma-glutamylcyclotransferase